MKNISQKHLPRNTRKRKSSSRSSRSVVVGGGEQSSESNTRKYSREDATSCISKLPYGLLM